MKSILFKPADDLMTVAQSALVRGIGFTNFDVVVQAVSDAMGQGLYRAVVVLPSLEGSEAVFDYCNLDAKNVDCMSVGDVIIWGNGKREVCLSNGWRYF